MPDMTSTVVLRNVNLTVHERDFRIIGPNGGGKTTLIKCILGLLKPISGEILYNGERLATSGKQTITRHSPLNTHRFTNHRLSSAV